MKMIVAESGTSVSIPCETGANVDPLNPVPLMWYRNGEHIKNSPSVNTDDDRRLILYSAQPYDSARYTCVKADGSGTASTRLLVSSGLHPGTFAVHFHYIHYIEKIQQCLYVRTWALYGINYNKRFSIICLTSKHVL